jgi:acetyl-CoA carboxylase carboxyl transferase subunit alpha
VTADKIKALNLIDDVIPEPLGGAHRDHDKMAEKLKGVLVRQLDELKSLSVKEMLEQRYNRLMEMGLS